MNKQKSKIQVPVDSVEPIRFNFNGKGHREGMLDRVRANYRTFDNQLILTASGSDTDLESFWLCADLDPTRARAVTKRLRDAMDVTRRTSSRYLDLRQLPQDRRYSGNTLMANFDPQFLPQVKVNVSFWLDRILLEIHGGNARARLWLDTTSSDALIFDLERCIQSAEVFR